MSAYPGFNGIKSKEGHSLCLLIWGVRSPSGVDTGGGLWNSQSLQLPWPSIVKHKQTNKIPTFLPTVFIQEKSQRPREIVVGCLLRRLGQAWPIEAPKASLWPRLASKSWASKPLSFIVYCPPGGEPNPLSVSTGMFWEPGLHSIHVSRPLWYILSPLIPTDAPWPSASHSHPRPDTPCLDGK